MEKARRRGREPGDDPLRHKRDSPFGNNGRASVRACLTSQKAGGKHGRPQGHRRASGHGAAWPARASPALVASVLRSGDRRLFRAAGGAGNAGLPGGGLPRRALWCDRGAQARRLGGALLGRDADGGGLHLGRLARGFGRGSRTRFPLLRPGGGAGRGHRPLELGRGPGDARPGAPAEGAGPMAGTGAHLLPRRVRDRRRPRSAHHDHRIPVAAARSGRARRLRFSPASLVRPAGRGGLHPQPRPDHRASGGGAGGSPSSSRSAWRCRST